MNGTRDIPVGPVSGKFWIDKADVNGHKEAKRFKK